MVEKSIKEDLLHFVWKYQRFETSQLISTAGEMIELIQFGQHNFDSGPDFLNAKIKIGPTTWAGNVEMHLKSSDWIKHKHQHDKAYNNVILHVVLEEDEIIYRENGERIPCLELQKRIPAGLSKNYQKLIHNEYWIPCQHLFHKVNSLSRSMWMERLLVERMEDKTNGIKVLLDRNKMDWEETFYQAMGKNFGVKTNADPFLQLTQAVQLKTLLKHKSSLFQMEALLFGQSGLLNSELQDEYPTKLKKEYDFLSTKYSLSPLNTEQWKFMRMRPANFPTIRIAQFVTLLFQTVHLFSKIFVVKNVTEIENMFELKLSNYWQDHYSFDKPSTKRKKSLGKTTIHLLIINTIAPFLFLYGKEKQEEHYKDLALKLLEETAPEKNSIISKWNDLGVDVESAAQTQALLQLKNRYCDKKRCLQCAIGSELLKS